jgi:hypothetical protein
MVSWEASSPIHSRRLAEAGEWKVIPLSPSRHSMPKRNFKYAVAARLQNPRVAPATMGLVIEIAESGHREELENVRGHVPGAGTRAT